MKNFEVQTVVNTWSIHLVSPVYASLVLLLLVLLCSSAFAVGEKDVSPLLPLLLLNKISDDNPITPTPLNDTGITWGANYPIGNNSDCSGTEIGAQDCSHGRDVTYKDESDGHAGFSFTKLDHNGEPLANQSVNYATTPWACVKDNVTGLIWEVKTNDGGLHDMNDSYTWYNTNSQTNGGEEGFADNGETCDGYNGSNASTFCNTQAFVARVNVSGWCGASDWRMPTYKELQGIVSYDRVSPAIDTDYFPNTPSDNTWTGSPLAYTSGQAWCLNSDIGSSTILEHTDSYPVRLVRGGP